MNQNKINDMASLFNNVGEEMIIAAGERANDLWLFAQAGEGWVGPALFRIGEGSLEWVSPISTDLGMAVLDLWNAEEPSKRWEGIEFEVHGMDFKTRFYYAGELPVEETGFERRYELIRRRFGNFNVIYPPDL